MLVTRWAFWATRSTSWHRNSILYLIQVQTWSPAAMPKYRGALVLKLRGDGQFLRVVSYEL